MLGGVFSYALQRVVSMLVLGALAWNYNLYNKGETVLLRSALTADKWHRDCLYYAPFRVFTIRRPVQFACSKSVLPDGSLRPVDTD